MPSRLCADTCFISGAFNLAAESRAFLLSKIMSYKQSKDEIIATIHETTELTIGEISYDLFGELCIGINVKLIAKHYLLQFNELIKSMTKEDAINSINTELKKQGELLTQNHNQ